MEIEALLGGIGDAEGAFGSDGEVIFGHDDDYENHGNACSHKHVL